MAKILIVDDDPVMHLLYLAHLQKQGHQLVVARDGEEGLTKVVEEMPELILLDIVLPGMDGLSFLRELRKSVTKESIPVIVITGLKADHTIMRKETEQAGASGFLSKPFSPAQLLGEVKRVLSAVGK